MPRYGMLKLIRLTNKLGPQLCQTSLTGRKRYVTPRYCRRQLVGLAKWQASQPCLTNLTLHISDTTVPNAEPWTKSLYYLSVSAEETHPQTLCGNTICFPTMEKLKQANSLQLSILTDEWCGGCPTTLYCVSSVLARNP
jgi:hypothetical protein